MRVAAEQQQNVCQEGSSNNQQSTSNSFKANSSQTLHTGFHSTWSWVCVYYALSVIALGMAFPMCLGVFLISNDNILDRYLAFYLYLYSVSVACMVIKYIVCDHTKTTLLELKELASKFLSRIPKLVKIGSKTAPMAAEENKNHQDRFGADEEKPIGRMGLQVGLKVTSVVLVVTVLLDISEFIHLEILGDLCQPDLKGAVPVFQLLYIIGLTYFCMNNHKIKLHKYPMFAHFCLAHLLATTVCSGLLFILYDTVEKLEPWILNEGKNKKQRVTDAPDTNILQSTPTMQMSYGELKTPREPQICHPKTYITDLSRHIGPYTFTFSMFYIYICSIILLHLILHYRGFTIKRNNQSSSAHLWTLFRRKPKGGLQNSVSSVASLSLIIGAFVVSILSLDGEDNVFIHIYLLILHSQANIVGLVVLKRLSPLPVDPKRSVAADYLVLLVSFFGVVLYNVTKHVTSVFDDEGISALEIATSAVEVMQTLEQTVLILVGLKVFIKNSEYANFPTELLLHLTAGNISALITSIFLTRMELFNMSEFLENSEHLFSLGVAWSVMGSVLLPWQAFYRYYSIICFAEVKKLLKETETNLI